MTDTLLRMLPGATLALALVLLLRRPVRTLFGAGPGFVLWLLPVVLAFSPLLPRQLAPTVVVTLPSLTVTPHADAATVFADAGIDWMQVLVALWLTGAGIALAGLTWNYANLRRRVLHGAQTWLAAVQAAEPGVDLRRVRVHADGPAVLWSMPRSLVLLPQDFARRFDDFATRQLVLRHELTHVRRGDAWWSLVMEIVSALLWFHPLVWLARSRFRLDQELACDAASLRGSPQPATGYARALLESIAVRPVPALIPWLSEPQLKERIAMIARIQPGVLRRRAGFVAVAMLLMTGLLLAGGQTPVHAATQTLSTSKPPSVDVAYKNEHPPRYPVEALRKGEQGKVVLAVTVNAYSKLRAVRVDPHGTNASASLRASAIAAAKGWHYNSGSEAGKPVGGVVRIPVMFSLTAVRDDAADDSSNVVSRNPPVYPVNALRNNEQGTVMLRVRVSASGDVTKVLIDTAKSTTTSAELQAAAVTAAEHWRLKPAQKDGKAVAGWQTVPVNFTMDEGDAGARTSSTRP